MKKTKNAELRKKPLSQKLYRSSDNKIIAGVCGGIAEYFNIDPIIIRIIFVILFLSHGSGLLIYLLLWLIIPYKSKLGGDMNDTVKTNFQEMKNSAHKIIDEVGNKTKKNQQKFVWGIVFMITGLIFLLDNFNIIPFDYIWRFWPVVLIIIGYLIITGYGGE